LPNFARRPASRRQASLHVFGRIPGVLARNTTPHTEQARIRLFTIITPMHACEQNLRVAVVAVT
jgi:hypothetical protein